MTREEWRRKNARYRAWVRRATARAKATLQPGQRVTRTLCAGRRGVFVFTHWDGDWACGKSVYDCHALHITKVDGDPVDFTNGEKRPNYTRPPQGGFLFDAAHASTRAGHGKESDG